MRLVSREAGQPGGGPARRRASREASQLGGQSVAHLYIFCCDEKSQSGLQCLLAAWQYLSQIHFPFRASSNATATGPAIRRNLAQQSDGHRRSNPTAIGAAIRRPQAQQSDCHMPSTPAATGSAIRLPQATGPATRLPEAMLPLIFYSRFCSLCCILVTQNSAA